MKCDIFLTFATLFYYISQKALENKVWFLLRDQVEVRLPIERRLYIP